MKLLLSRATTAAIRDAIRHLSPHPDVVYVDRTRDISLNITRSSPRGTWHILQVEGSDVVEAMDDLASGNPLSVVPATTYKLRWRLALKYRRTFVVEPADVSIMPISDHPELDEPGWRTMLFEWRAGTLHVGESEALELAEQISHAVPLPTYER
ncbi:hypothetical protein [Spirillospora sp. NBC_01491]|uniref:hypothetical protein n=1 Tax=Spirillospora sp. NBC_01491 TaxID=2976007 RepID=UPI002E33AB72|nr:hypothetical protein [Spirillospora sp. NBC_01491]